MLAKMAAGYRKSGRMAMVLGKTIHLYGVSRKQFLAEKNWVQHELKHIEQFERLGFIRFLTLYIWLSIKYGYYNHPMEQEARNAESDFVEAQKYYW